MRLASLVSTILLVLAGLAMASPLQAAIPEAAESGTTLGAPITHGSLTVFPILSPGASQRPAPAVDLLSEALAAGTLEIREKGAEGDVPTLVAINKGERPVMLLTGQVVAGGKQDRVMTQDTLVEPSGDPVDIAVNCVEQGRWAHTGEEFSAVGSAELDLKKTLRKEKSQASTWAKVAELNQLKAAALSQQGRAAEASALSPGSGTYRASMQGSETMKQQALQTRQAIETAMEELTDVVGIVGVVGDSIEGAHVMAHPELFTRARGELLDGLALQAATAPAGTDLPQMGEVEKWLAAGRNNTGRKARVDEQSSYKLEALGTVLVEEVY